MAATTLPEEQLLELLTQLQKTTPDQVKAILNPQVAIANALLKLMIKMDIVSADSLMKHLSGIVAPSAATASILAPDSALATAATTSPAPPLPPPAAAMPPSFMPPHITQARFPSHTPTPPISNMPPPPPAAASYQQYASLPPPTYPSSYPPQQAPPPQQHVPFNYHTPPPVPPPQQQQYGSYPAPAPAIPPLPDAFSHLPEDQRAMIRHVMSMTPAQVQQLPPAERSNIIQLRSTLGLPSE